MAAYSVDIFFQKSILIIIEQIIMVKKNHKAVRSKLSQIAWRWRLIVRLGGNYP